MNLINKRYQIIALFLMPIVCLAANAETLRWNVQAKYGMTAAGIQKAVDDAKTRFSQTPNDVVILQFEEGSFWLEDKDSSKGTIDLSGVKPGPDGRLIFQGAGMDRTILVFADNKHALYGRDVHRVTFADMHMTRKDYTVSQGLVVQVAKGSITLDIHEGFPTPAAIFNPMSKQGRFLRRYTDSAADPQVIEENNEQIPWTRATHVEGRQWQLELRPKNLVANYSVGDLVGIKSKHSKGKTEFDGQTYWFCGGSDFLFKSVKWTHKSRGVFRGGFEKVHVIDCVVDRAPAIEGRTPCLSTPGGGPQIGQPNDPATSGHLVKNCRFIGLGDDAVAFFNATGEISGCYIQDSFVRGILVANAPESVVKDNTVIRCPVQRSKGWRFHRNHGGTKKLEADALRAEVEAFHKTLADLIIEGKDEAMFDMHSDDYHQLVTLEDGTVKEFFYTRKKLLEQMKHTRKSWTPKSICFYILKVEACDNGQIVVVAQSKCKFERDGVLHEKEQKVTQIFKRVDGKLRLYQDAYAVSSDQADTDSP